MAFERAKSIALHDHAAPIITTIAALVAFILSIIALVSTSQKMGLAQYNMVMLNTSTLFQNAIKVNTNGAAVTARAIHDARMPAPTPAPILDERQFSLPNPSQVSSFFNSVGSGLSSAVSPQSTGAGGTGGGGSGLLGDLENFFNSLVGSATGAAGGEIVNVVNSIVGDVTDALGIQDWYGLYLTGFCDGTYGSGDSMNTTKCTPYSNLHINSTSNSTVQLGTTTVDFSALNIPNKLSQSGGQIKAILTAIIALQIIGIVSSGILIFLTPLTLLISFFDRFIVRLIIGTLAAIAAACFAVIAGIATGIQVVVSSLINQLGGGLGIEAYSGGNFLALVWISYLFMMFSAVLWFVRWHSHRYVRRGRELGGGQRPLAKTAESGFIIK